MKTVNLTEAEHAEILKLRAKNKATASTPNTRDVVRAETLEVIYDKANGVKATWSDAARKAAAEARKNHVGKAGITSIAPILEGGKRSSKMMAVVPKKNGDVNKSAQHLEEAGHEIHKIIPGDENAHPAVVFTPHQGSELTSQEKKTAEQMAERSDHTDSQDFHDSLNEESAWEGSGIPKHKQEAALDHAVNHHMKLNGTDSTSRSFSTITAAGTSEGVKKSWESRRSHAYALSNTANERSDFNAGKPENHWAAANAHLHAKEAHGNLANDLSDEGMKTSAGVHEHLKEYHEKKWKEHTKAAGGEVWGEKSKASDTTPSDVIHCRSQFSASGPVLAADKQWNAGEPVEFMWMPAGVHTICAGFRNGSIELTVKCDESTTANVQASLDAWRTERPKQEPFGCVEHREHEASVRVSAQQAFSFKNDGVYIAAEPTALGAQNVNGKVHRSWSPSFTTDADYGQAKTVKTSSGATVMVFPEGVRGSRSNPAEITGVDFCVGTLTNKPAFHAMSPVKGSEVEDAVLAAGTSEGAKKGWEKRSEYHGALAGNHSRDAIRRADQHKLNSAFESAHAAGYHARQLSLSGESNLHAYNAHSAAANAYKAVKEEALKQGEKEHAQDAGNMEDEHVEHAEAHRLALAKSIKSSDANPSASIHAHCKAALLEEVPDATPEEIACYEKCIDGGGSHPTAVAEVKAKRKPEYKTQASESVRAAWSDAAREAAAHARELSRLAHEEPMKRSMDGKPRADVTAYAITKQAHKASKDTKDKEINGGGHGYQIDSHNYAAFMHTEAAKAHGNAKDSFMKELHSKAAEAHREASSEIWKANNDSPKASEPASPDTIAARQSQALDAANKIAAAKGVARTALDDVYEKVTATGTSEGAKKGWESRINSGLVRLQVNGPGGPINVAGVIKRRMPAGHKDAGKLEVKTQQHGYALVTDEHLDKHNPTTQASSFDLDTESIYATGTSEGAKEGWRTRKFHFSPDGSQIPAADAGNLSESFVAEISHLGEAATAEVAVKPGKGYGITTDKGSWGNGRWIVQPKPHHKREAMAAAVATLKSLPGVSEMRAANKASDATSILETLYARAGETA